MTTRSPSRPCRGYVQAVLAAYLELPETPARARHPDRQLAHQLCQRAIPLSVVKDALLLATARRLTRPLNAPRLSPIHSLYYFLPVIEEVLQNPLPTGYAEYLSNKVRLFIQPLSGH
ncbi:MAG: hypothetical protein ACE5MH_07145, partial [Terriglobia bacterium]